MIINLHFIIFFTLLAAIFVMGEILLKLRIFVPEFTRKFTHLSTGLIVFFMPSYLSLSQAVILSILAMVFLFFAERLKLLPSVTGIKRRSYGSIMFPLGLMISGLLFWESNLTAFRVSVLVLAISDSIAGLVGKKIGKRNFLSGTIEGSIAFFMITFAIFFLFTANNFSEITLIYILGISAALTFLEVSLSKGFDNLFLPPAAAVLASGLF